jgi:hypothetical protein
VLALLAACLLLATSGVAVAAAPAPQAPDPEDLPYRAASPEYGTVVQIFGEPTAERDMQLVAAMGFTWIKVTMPWRAMEPQHQVYDWTESDRLVELADNYGLKIIARIADSPAWARADGGNNGAVDSPPDDYQDYANFIGAFTGHYKRDNRRVYAIEVWNEPNINREWAMQVPDPAAYTRLLRLSYVAAKAESPRMTILNGALTPTGTWDDTSQPDDVFLQGMYNAGAGGFFDVLSVHAPGYKAAPETSPDDIANDPTLGGHRFFGFRHVEDLRNIMVANGDEPKQIWITELGWTSDTIHADYAWFQVPEETKADYLVRAFQWAHNNWAPWIGVMTAWSISAPYWTPDDEQYWWAITNPDGTTRPAYDRLAAARAAGELP